MKLANVGLGTLDGNSRVEFRTSQQGVIYIGLLLQPNVGLGTSKPTKKTRFVIKILT